MVITDSASIACMATYGHGEFSERHLTPSVEDLGFSSEMDLFCLKINQKQF